MIFVTPTDETYDVLRTPLAVRKEVREYFYRMVTSGVSFAIYLRNAVDADGNKLDGIVCANLDTLFLRDGVHYVANGTMAIDVSGIAVEAIR